MKNDLICGKNILTYLKLRGMRKLHKKALQLYHNTRLVSTCLKTKIESSIHIKALAFPLKDKNNTGHFAITLIKTNCSFLSL